MKKKTRAGYAAASRGYRFHDGVLAAIEEARKLNEPFLLDAFHDLLVDKLRDELMMRNKLKQEE